MAAPTNYIEQHLAEDRVLDLLIDILTDEFGAEVDALYNRTAGFTGSTPADSTAFTEGIYLPDPDAIYRQAAPTTEQEKDIGHVAAFVGPVGEAAPTSTAAEVSLDQGFVWQYEQPFAVTFVFGRAAQPVVSDAFSGRDLREEEIVRKRASYYAGAIAHTIFKYGRGETAIWGTRPGTLSSQNAELQIGEEDYALVGVASYEFQVINYRLFPALSNRS